MRACVRLKILMTFCPQKTPCIAHLGNYSIEFFSFHASHTWKWLSEKQPELGVKGKAVRKDQGPVLTGTVLHNLAQLIKPSIQSFPNNFLKIC